MKGSAAKKRGEVIPISRRVQGHRSGILVGRDVRGGVLVDYPGNVHGPLAALATIKISQRAIDAQVAVLLAFVDERDDRPVIIGRIMPMQPLGAPKLKPLATVLNLEATEEIVLRCGPSRISLRHDGRIVVRGVTVESQADGLNRLKGGAVRVN